MASAMPSKSYVVYDCDIGTDDAWGLAMLLRAEQHLEKRDKKFQLVAITCVQGNTDVDNGTRNALRVLHTLDRLDVPVYKGCSDPIVPRNWQRQMLFHGSDGLGDVGDYPPVQEERYQLEEHAVNAMYRLACQYPKQVDFILCGPLTNFANCINIYGDRFLDNLGSVYIMGGNLQGKGNITKSAEFNFIMDPEAAHIVLERLKKPALILPWEPCIDGEFGLTLDWRLNVLGGSAAEQPFIDLLNRAESSVLLSKGFTKWLTCDALLTAAYLLPKLMIADERTYYATVELTGVHTRGQMVLDHLKGRRLDDQHGKPMNVRIIRKLNGEAYRKIISWTGWLKDVEDIAQLWEQEQSL
ncbi:uncharacterized protein Dwil_GK25813 [Drosophila willistoni]|uniref:Inosine/uridine-preferring nucleoside hydrolase domain-containing protein n=1 Tax=Drosophila willistoni TaxID=7260 RepID=B4NC88_DROWI|nr:inosine-uridine preferring nucleoside hydrolase [Drosophila willistoni]EDW82447.1 uncharacterized protein Dwil_GK25813 [Drosophila willistoni]